jgi:hypothetical protein
VKLTNMSGFSPTIDVIRPSSLLMEVLEHDVDLRPKPNAVGYNWNLGMSPMVLLLEIALVEPLNRSSSSSHFVAFASPGRWIVS